ncbi:hypothetical protein ACFQAT_09990 [Undibacterium arcticum]|uniref:hypothetical protein n=1 Tax=Undibacterium arcticum TaxID=1762892 RepID=UPI003605C0E8
MSDEKKTHLSEFDSLTVRSVSQDVVTSISNPYLKPIQEKIPETQSYLESGVVEKRIRSCIDYFSEASYT